MDCTPTVRAFTSSDAVMRMWEGDLCGVVVESMNKARVHCVLHSVSSQLQEVDVGPGVQAEQGMRRA